MENQKGVSTLIGIIIIVFVVVIAFGGIFSYQYFATKANNQPQVQSQQQNQNQQQAINSQNNNVQLVNQIADWKTYDRGDGFEFKYPKEWVVNTVVNRTNTAVNIWNSANKMQESINSKNAGLPPIYPELSVSYQDLSSFNKSVEDLAGKKVSSVKDLVQSATFNGFAELSVSGKKAYATLVVANRAVYTIYIETGNRVYVISTEAVDYNNSFHPENVKLDENIENIVSTFKIF